MAGQHGFFKTGEANSRITGNSIADTWKNLVEKIYYYGYLAVTPKDEGTGKELRGVTLKVPIKKPRTHEWYGGIAKQEGEALETYIDQVVGEGSHDLQRESPFKYTYHQVLRHHGVKYPWEQGGYDQIQAIVDYIMPFKRSHLAVTWRVPEDNQGDLTGGDQPCLIMLWCWLGWDTEIFKEEAEEITALYRENKKTDYVDLLKKVNEWLWATYTDNRSFRPVLEMECVWRNRDGGAAWLDNVCAMTTQQMLIAGMIQDRIRIPVDVGDYYEHNSAIQIYPRDFEAIERAIKQKRR